MCSFIYYCGFYSLRKISGARPFRHWCQFYWCRDPNGPPSSTQARSECHPRIAMYWLLFIGLLVVLNGQITTAGILALTSLRGTGSQSEIGVSWRSHWASTNFEVIALSIVRSRERPSNDMSSQRSMKCLPDINDLSTWHAPPDLSWHLTFLCPFSCVA